MHVIVKRALFRNTQYRDRNSSETKVSLIGQVDLVLTFQFLFLHKSIKVRSVQAIVHCSLTSHLGAQMLLYRPNNNTQ